MLNLNDDFRIVQIKREKKLKLLGINPMHNINLENRETRN